MEIALALDGYNDIFDDFDIRSYKERAVSVDFIEELNRRISKVGYNEKMSIVLTLPRYKRMRKEERTISRRLKTYFENKYEFYTRKKKQSWTKIGIFLALGLASMVASFFAEGINEALSEYFIIGVYFFTWQGLDEFIYGYPKIKKRVERYRHLKEAKITFVDEEVYRP